MFDRCFARTMGSEGGYANRKKDRGGETYKGISRKYHPDWDGWEIVDMAKTRFDGISALKKGDVTPVLGKAYQQKLEQLVRNFYYEKFWKRIRGDDIEYIAGEDVACETFDAQVNPTSGVNGAKLLQEAINRLGGSVVVDGVVGPKTLAALRDIEKGRLLDTMERLRALHYAEEVKSDPSQIVFLEGWLKRALKLA